MGASRFLTAAVLLSALLPTVGRAQQKPPPELEGEEIGIDAEQISYDQKTDTVVARGKVVIRRGDTELRAEEVRLNRATNEATAHGDVTVLNPDGTISASAVHLNLDEETGLLEDARIESRRLPYSLWGERVEKGLGQSYHIENGRFTTCRCAGGAPSWSVSGEDLRLTLGGYGIVRGGTFNILDVPILYVPQALFPVQRERQSGFLMPQFGASNRRGFQALVPFYWAINKSQDATLAFDLETSARAGLVSEYRYALSRETRGSVSASYFNESLRGAATIKPFEMNVPENRWSVVAEHEQPLLTEGHGYADVFLVGDDLFLRDINTYAFDHSRDVAIRTLPFTKSRAGALRLWNRFALQADGVYYQNLSGGESQTLQRAPEVHLWGQGRLGGALLGALNATVVDFQRGQNVDGVRLDLEPAVVIPLPLGRYGFGAVRTAFRETAYHLTDQTLTATGTELPENRSRELVQVGAEINTIVNRTYPFPWLGLDKVKHTIEPGIAYLYIPAVSQGDLPLFDGVDRVNRRNLFTYGVVSRLLGRFAGQPEATANSDGATPAPADAAVRELGRVSLTQSLDVTRELEPLQAGRAADHFSDIDFAGRVNPSSSLSMRFHTSYDASTNNISAAKVGFFVEDPRSQGASSNPLRLETRSSAGVSYRFLTGNLLQEVDSNVVLRLTDWAGFLYSSRYDVVADRFLDNFFGLRLLSTCDCWALEISVADRTNPQEVEVRAQLTLVGLGSDVPQRRVAAAP